MAVPESITTAVRAPSMSTASSAAGGGVGTGGDAEQGDPLLGERLREPCDRGHRCPETGGLLVAEAADRQCALVEEVQGMAQDPQPLGVVRSGARSRTGPPGIGGDQGPGDQRQPPSPAAGQRGGVQRVVPLTPPKHRHGTPAGGGQAGRGGATGSRRRVRRPVRRRHQRTKAGSSGRRCGCL